MQRTSQKLVFWVQLKAIMLRQKFLLHSGANLSVLARPRPIVLLLLLLILLVWGV